MEISSISRAAATFSGAAKKLDAVNREWRHKGLISQLLSKGALRTQLAEGHAQVQAGLRLLDDVDSVFAPGIRKRLGGIADPSESVGFLGNIPKATRDLHGESGAAGRLLDEVADARSLTSEAEVRVALEGGDARTGVVLNESPVLPELPVLDRARVLNIQVKRDYQKLAEDIYRRDYHDDIYGEVGIRPDHAVRLDVSLGAVDRAGVDRMIRASIRDGEPARLEDVLRIRTILTELPEALRPTVPPKFDEATVFRDLTEVARNRARLGRHTLIDVPIGRPEGRTFHELRSRFRRELE